MNGSKWTSIEYRTPEGEAPSVIIGRQYFRGVRGVGRISEHRVRIWNKPTEASRARVERVIDWIRANFMPEDRR